MKRVRSPITGSANVTLVRRIDCRSLVKEYERILAFDISHLMGEHQEIVLYKCNESGYRFYDPADVVGDGAFYHHLEAFGWYYMPTKWEFEEALAFLHDGASVLEMGSAKGDFLSQVCKAVPNVSCVGLELNEEAARTARNRGMDVVVESCSEHAMRHSSRYDAIASFQVLEHVADPMGFLRDALTMLKPGGVLIVGVPDNSVRSAASIFVRSDNILNMPPHHQGLWDIPSLAFLSKVLPVTLERLVVEPATASHQRNSYRGLMKNDLTLRFGPVLGFAIYVLGRPFYDHALEHLSQYLPAHSILAVFRKKEAG